MDQFLVAIIQGIVEGLTEFIPVSSTGHLILSGTLLGFQGEKAATFEVFIQLGAILAVAILYWQRILSLFGLSRSRTHRLSLIHIIVAMIPAVVLGLLVHDFIKEHLFTPSTVVVSLVVGGFLMIFADRTMQKNSAKNLDQITITQAFKVGLFQCLALWPGFSRSGATIAGGMLVGIDRKTAADFSFIVAIPMMIAASGFDLLKAFKEHLITSADIPFFAVGFVTSFIVAWIAVVWFMKLLERVKLTPFAIYRFVLAGVFSVFILGGLVK